MSTSLDKTSAKILVLGDSGVGKSSLIHLICHSTVLSSAQWTIGCSIEVKLHGNCFLEFWDIGGSRGHKIARSFLYQDYHGIILVFDATNRKSRLNLNEWLVEATQKNNDKDLMDTYANINVPTITIGTKRDLLPHGGSLDLDDDSISNNSENSSVVNFNEDVTSNQQTTRAYSPARTANHSTSNTKSASPIVSTSPFASFHSTNSSLNEPLLERHLIYVNTQDVLSFASGSKNHELLTRFFKEVVDRRNKKFYNKFAI